MSYLTAAAIAALATTAFVLHGRVFKDENFPRDPKYWISLSLGWIYPIIVALSKLEILEATPPMWLYASLASLSALALAATYFMLWVDSLRKRFIT